MKYSSTDFNLFVDGYDLTPSLNENASRKHENLTQPTRPFGMANDRNTPTGIAKDTLAVGGGLFDEAVDPLHAAKITDGGIGVNRVICFCDQGQTKGAHFTGYEAAYAQSSEPLGAVGSLTKANVVYEMNGKSDEGVILQELAAQTADWDTEASSVDAADDEGARRIPITSSSAANPTHIVTPVPHGMVSGDIVAIFNHTSVAPDINDNPAAAEAWKLIGHEITYVSATEYTIPVNVTDGGTGGYCICVSKALGGYGYLQVLQGSGVTGYVAKVRHSTDNSTFADLITFTDTAASYHAKERKATATTTTRVHRYTAWKGDLTTAVGATPYKVFGGFCRGV